MKDRTWEYIGGHQWSLVDNTSLYKDHLCTVEIEKGKYPIVGYCSVGLDQEDLQNILNIIKEEYE
jgi:hypothetical protein